jgi:hypothetical protein
MDGDHTLRGLSACGLSVFIAWAVNMTRRLVLSAAALRDAPGEEINERPQGQATSL